MATIKILDGGMATQLSLYVNEKNIESDGHPLWVSRFLLTNPEAIELAQLDYLRGMTIMCIMNAAFWPIS